MTYSRKIREIREIIGISQRSLAEKINVNHSTISLLEKGTRGKAKKDISPEINTLMAICKGCNYPFRQFLEEAGYIEPVTYAEPVRQRLTELQIACGELHGKLEQQALDYVNAIKGDNKYFENKYNKISKDY